MNTMGSQCINGAGAPKKYGIHAGEDYTKYRVKGSGCKLRVHPHRSRFEPLNHFHDGMLWGKPALVTAERFYKDAVRVWKHGDKKQAAFILGRALHVVEDMAQPQHAMNEEHYPYFPLFDKSFLEYFTEAHLKPNTNGNAWCPDSDVDYNSLIDSITAAPLINKEDPVSYAVNGMATDSTNVGTDDMGKNYTVEDLNRIYGDDYVPITHGFYKKFTLPFQTLQDDAPVCVTMDYHGTAKGFQNSRTDYIGYSAGDTGSSGTIIYRPNRVDFAMKLSQGDMDSKDKGSFERGEHLEGLLQPCVQYGAGLIIAFWNDVKDYSCGGENSGKATGTCALCPVNTPGGESPDDSRQVKSSLSAETDKIPASFDWHDLCRVGIGRGLSTMADYGISSSMVEQYADVDPDSIAPDVREALSEKLDSILERNKGQQNTMPSQVDDAPQVAVWDKGFGYDALDLIEADEEPVKVLEEPQEPVFTDEESLSILPPRRGLLEADASKQKILVIPTGSLYTLRDNSTEHSVLESFVNNGGVIVCFTQAYGDDFSALPVPDGEELVAAGFKQDLSCFANSAFPTMEHPILSGITGTSITAGFDGYFRKIPSNAKVLLRRTISGEPCLIAYQVGQGWVVASTMYEDWAHSNGQSTKDGRTLIANILSWAKNPAGTIPATNLSAGDSASAVSLTLHVRNLSDTDADQMKVIVMTPDRQAMAAETTIPVSLAAHSQTDVPVTLDLSSYFGQTAPEYGILHADYVLFASNTDTGEEEIIQPQGETDTGRFVVESTGNARQAVSQTIFSTWTDDDVAGNPAKTVHVYLKDNTGTARTMHLWTCYWHNNGILLDTINLPANGELYKDYVMDLSRVGSYHFYLMDPDYGFVPGTKWSFMWGNDPWKMAAQGYAYMFRNSGFVTLSPISGLQDSYEPVDTVNGSIKLTNPNTWAEDLTVVFSLVAGGSTALQNQTVHLEPGASQNTAFSLDLPGVQAYYTYALITASVSLNQSLVGGTYSRVQVHPWLPDPVVTPAWPASPTLTSLASDPLSVHIENKTGARTAPTVDCSLVARVWDITSTNPLDVETVPLPVLQPGDSTDIDVNWSQWQPVAGKIYSISIWVEGQDSNYWGNSSKQFKIVLPSLTSEAIWVRPGDANVTLKAPFINMGSLDWSGQLTWDCPALGISVTKDEVIPAGESGAFTMEVPRPDGLVPGTYEYTATFTGQGLTDPLVTNGRMSFSAPLLRLAWPDNPPQMRHDTDVTLPVVIKTLDLAAPLAGTVDAVMTWDGGSAQIADGQAVTLDPVNPLNIDLTLPVTRMPAPGNFDVRVTLHVAQGNITKSWNASYNLGYPVYTGGFSVSTAAPGDTITGEIQNTGAFEGNAEVYWSLVDSTDRRVAEDTQNITVPAGGTATINETLPSHLLAGEYGCNLLITDSTTGEKVTIRNTLTVTGENPVFSFSTDSKVYGSQDPVTAVLQGNDPGRVFDNEGAYLAIQRYVGRGGSGTGGGQMSASWNTPMLDGSGNYRADQSEWFVDAATGKGAYVYDASTEQPESNIPQVAADVNGDGIADRIALVDDTLRIVSEGDLSDLSPASSPVKREAISKRSRRDSLMQKKRLSLSGKVKTLKGVTATKTAGKESAATANSTKQTKASFDSWLTYPVAETWGAAGDSWDTPFLLGVRDDAQGSSNPLVLGMYSSSAQTASVLLVQLDGTVAWRHDFAAPFTPKYVDLSNTGRAAGPVFADLNGDNVKDVLFQSDNAVYALDGDTGTILWDTTSEVGGGTVEAWRLGNSLQGYRIWVVYSTSSSSYNAQNLLLLDGAGNEIYTAVPSDEMDVDCFTVGDIDGDGNDEALVTKGWNGDYPALQIFSVAGSTPVDTSFVPRGDVLMADLTRTGRQDAIFAVNSAGGNPATVTVKAVDMSTQTALWSTLLPAPADSGLGFEACMPLLYRTPSGQQKILLIELLFPEEQSVIWAPGQGYSLQFYLMDASTGAVEQSVDDGGIWSSGNMVLGDFDGDGLSELYAGGLMLDAGCDDGAGGYGACEEWETVWEKWDTLSENASGNLDVSYTPGVMGITGTYRTIAYLSSANDQEIDVAPYGFSVVDTNLALTFSPAPDTTIRTDETLKGSLTLKNRGTATEEAMTVTALVDGQAFLTQDVASLAPGETQDFTFSLPAATAGKNQLEATVEQNGTVVSENHSAYISANPAVSIGMDAPSSHTESPFDITVTAENDGDVPALITLTPSDDPSQAVTLALGVQEVKTATFTRQAAADYSGNIVLSGDVQKTLAVNVPSAYRLSITADDPGPLKTGVVDLPVRVSQAGDVSYDGSLVATITQSGGSSTSTTLPIHVNANDSSNVTMPLPLNVPGTTHLTLSASLTGAILNKDLSVYRDGMGTLSINIPSTVEEGLLELPFTVRNNLPVEGNFAVQLLWDGGNGSEEVAETALQAGASQSVDGILAPTLTPGEGTMQVILNGVEVASGSVTVLPKISAELSLTSVNPADASPSATVEVHNSGFEAIDAVLQIQSDTLTSTTLHIEPGETVTHNITFAPDNFAGEEADITAKLMLPDNTDITKSLSITLEPVEVSVTPSASPEVLVPGETGVISFDATNTGDKTAGLLLSVNFEDGDMGYFEQTLDLAGHATSPIAVSVPLPWDIPNGESNAHWEIGYSNDPSTVLAEGDIPVEITGPTVRASASLDGVAYPTGGTANLSVNLSLVPAGSDPREVTIRAIAGNYEEERDISVTGDQNEGFSVPIEEGTDGVTVEVVQPGGRTLYINRFRVYTIGDGFAIYPDKNVYQAGESVNVSAVLPSEGSIDLNFMGQEATLQGSGTLVHSFTIPADAAENSYTVDYDYSPTDTTETPASGSMLVDVHGIVVTGGESHLDKQRYSSGENLTGEMVFYSKTSFSGTLHFWIFYPDGSYGYAGDMAVELDGGSSPARIPFSLPFSTADSGTHRVAYSLAGASGTMYLGGSLPFSVGAGVLLGVGTTQADYPLGTEEVSASVRTAGTGTANLKIEVDGNAVVQTDETLSGVQTFNLSLGTFSPGKHSIKATLTDGQGLASVARSGFYYGSELPDLTGFVGAGCRIDNSVPLITVVENHGTGTAGSSTALLYDGDPQSGGIQISAVPVPELPPGGQFTFNYDWDITGEEGTHELYFVVDGMSAVAEWDESNNSYHTTTTIEPALQISIQPADNTCSSQPITPSVEVMPEGTQFTATLDGNEYVSGTPIDVEGDHEFTVSALNACGGTGKTETVHYTIDTTAPEVTINGVEEGGSYSDTVAPTFEATDENLTATTALLNGAPFRSGTVVTGAGDYTLIVTAQDCAGNTGQKTVHFTLTGSPVPQLPDLLSQVAWFGCDEVSISGNTHVSAMPSLSGPQGFGGHVASNGSISISGSNTIDGNVTPGPGQVVEIHGKKNRILGSTLPALETVSCADQTAADWLVYATDNNDNSLIPEQFLDSDGGFKLNGNKTCVLPGGVYLVHSFTMNGTSRLVAANPVIMVVTGPIVVNGSCKLNEGDLPENVTLISASTMHVLLKGNATANLRVFAPMSHITIGGNLTGIGNLWGKTLTASGGVVWNRIEAPETISDDQIALETPLAPFGTGVVHLRPAGALITALPEITMQMSAK